MKKIMITVMMLFAFIALAACNGNEAENSQNYNSTEISPIPHVGAAHETHEIVFALDLPNADWQVRSIQVGADHGGFGYGEYTLTIFYEPHGDFEGEISQRIPEIFFESTADRLFDLIGNLQAVTFSVNSERTASDVIIGYDYRFSITRSGARQFTPIASLPAEELKIQIDVATEERLSTFANVHYADLDVLGHGEGVNLVVWANMPLPHLAVITLEPEWLEDRDAWGFSPRDNFGYVETLLPGEGYVINNYMGLGTLPNRGIGFFDAEKRETRVFFFQENHAYPEHGNQWIIQEIEADRLIWGFPGGGADLPSEEGYSIVINGVSFEPYSYAIDEGYITADVVYTITGEEFPTHVTFSALWGLGLDAISGGAQHSLQHNGGSIGVELISVNYLTFGADRVAVGINDTFMADDGAFTTFIPISLIRALGFDVYFEGGRVHIDGQFNVPINPHPLAIALQEFIANAEGETQAHIPNVGGNLSVLAIKFVDGFAEATLFVYTGREVISKEIGSIEGFPFSVGFTIGWGSLVKMTGDGGNRSYTMFGVTTNLATSRDEIVYLFTIYAVRADDGSIHYSRFDGGWLEGIEGGRYPITEEEFYAIRAEMGDRITSWRDSWDSTESILAWVANLPNW